MILGVRDLEAAARRLYEEYGLASVAGGRHLGHGTGNRIVPLGPDYLELLAVVDREEAANSLLGRTVSAQLADGDRFLGLCLRTDDIDREAARLELGPRTMSRRRPDGRELVWRLAGLESALPPRSLPFFIEWRVPDTLHPGREIAAHRVSPRGIAWVEVGGDFRELTDWVGGTSLALRSVPGPPGVRAVGIRTVEGGTTLRHGLELS